MTDYEYQQQLEELEQMEADKAIMSPDKLVRDSWEAKTMFIYGSEPDLESCDSEQKDLVRQVLSDLNKRITQSRADPAGFKAQKAYEMKLKLDANKQLIKAKVPMKEQQQ
jgi:predicted metal-dependent RNase